MRNGVWMIAALLVALALAGCSDDDGESTTSTHTPPTFPAFQSGTGTATASGSASATDTSTTSPPADSDNQAPTGSVAVAVNGTSATFTLTGSDPDGDTLVWDLAFGDGNATNGTTLPATVEHTYAAGNFTAMFTVTDGQAPTSYDVALAISAVAGATSFVITGSTSQTGSPASSGVLLGGTPGLGAKACAGFMTDMNEVDCVFGAVPAEMAGRTYLYESTVDSPGFEFYDTCTPDGTATQAFGGAATGAVPDGTGCVIMWNFGSATGEFTMTIA